MSQSHLRRAARPCVALAAMALTGCGPSGAPTMPVGLASMTLGALAAPQAAPTPAVRSAVQTTPAAGLELPAVPMPTVTPTTAATGDRPNPGAMPNAIDPNAPRLRLSDGREIALSGGDAVALPAGVSGLVSLFAPGRVPSTLEVPAGLAALHPSAIAPAPEPTGLAVLEGHAAPGAAVAYYGPGRRAFVGAFADAAGRYRLEVPLDGTESGAVMARDAQAVPHLALAPVTIHAEATTAGPALALAPSTGTIAAPPPPSGWGWAGAGLSAVPEQASAPWRVPVIARDGDAVPTYALPGFSPVASFLAESPDRQQGALVSGPAAGVPAWLAPPDLAALPARLEAGQALDWPVVPEATLYTVRLTSPAQPSPVWEAACVTPHLVVPSGLALEQPGLKLEVTAWSVPELTVYSVAGLRALRLPDGPAGLSGRLSWSRRAVGEPAK